jgi:hypothetical protein
MDPKDDPGSIENLVYGHLRYETLTTLRKVAGRVLRHETPGTRNHHLAARVYDELSEAQRQALERVKRWQDAP